MQKNRQAVMDVSSLKEAESILLKHKDVMLCRIAVAELSAPIALLRDEMMRLNLSSFLKAAASFGADESGVNEFRRNFKDADDGVLTGLPFNFPRKKSCFKIYTKPGFVFGKNANGDDICGDDAVRRIRTLLLLSNDNQHLQPGIHKDGGYLTFCFYMQGQGLTYYNQDEKTVLWRQPHSDEQKYITVHRGRKHPLNPLFKTSAAAPHTGHYHDNEQRASMTFTYFDADPNYE